MLHMLLYPFPRCTDITISTLGADKIINVLQKYLLHHISCATTMTETMILPWAFLDLTLHRHLAWFILQKYIQTLISWNSWKETSSDVLYNWTLGQSHILCFPTRLESFDMGFKHLINEIWIRKQDFWSSIHTPKMLYCSSFSHIASNQTNWPN